jgi:predicted permease
MQKERDDELRREIESHLDAEAEDNVADGMSAGQAREAARRRFGNVTRTQEDVRAVWTRTWLADLRLDVRHAGRMLLKNRAFTAIAVLTLALGIGANTAIFSLVHAVAIRPLPFPDPDRLVVIWEDFRGRGGAATVEAAPGNFKDWKDQNRVFEGMEVITGRETFNLTGSGDPERLSGARVTDNLFSLLGVRPVLGRVFLDDSDRARGNPVALISDGLWRRRFGADPSLVGRTIALDGLPHTVLGIVPADLQFPAKGAEVWVPVPFTPEQLAQRTTWYLHVVARLKPGVSLEQARADMGSIAQRLAEQHPGTNARLGVNVVPLHEQYVGAARPLLILLVGTVGVVLLIACVNVAHLLLARGAERRREIAVRCAIGAGRGRVLRQLSTESAVLGALGTFVGVGLALAASRFLTRLIPENFPHGMTLGLEPTVLYVSAAVALVTTVLFGTGPSFAASRVDLQDALRQAAMRGSTRRDRGIRSALVVAEVALTVVLLTAAGLLLRSYSQLSVVDIGFPARGLLVGETPLAPSRYRGTPRRAQFVADVLQRLQALPGVESAGYVNYLPMTFPGGFNGFAIEGRPAPTATQVPRQMAINRAITPDYLRTLGVPVRRGRYFEERDGADAPGVVIINDTMARTFWGREDPIGQRILFGGPQAPWRTIVGVVGDVRQIELDLSPQPEMFVPLTQLPAITPPFIWPRHFVIRTAGDPLALTAAVRAAIASVDEDQPVANLQTMEQLVDAQLADRGTQLTLISAFSILALVLASVGLYGVLAYAVTQQTPEIGLRMALGATSTSVVSTLVRRTFILTGAGLVIGLAVASLVTRTFAVLLYEVSPTDPFAFAATAGVLIAVAAVACLAPARRATRIDPLVALRAE